MTAVLPGIWKGIEIKWSSESPPDDEPIDAAARLLEAISGQIPPPEGAWRGYWPTVYFSWMEGVIGLEITWTEYVLFNFEQEKGFFVDEYEFSRPDALADLIEHLSRLIHTPSRST